ncbi:MAG: hypothetical protein U5K33_08630 [Halofilum sp. (in: g-proteobacteria)]|nr:hypothetical protein [Halofilum sp. (in: g-proteobacteria)]
MHAAPDADIETIPDLDGRRIGALAGSVNPGRPEGLRSQESAP